MEQFITTLFNGFSLSSIILLTSIGLAITFGLMKVINMAHGEFVMIGAYMTFVVQEFLKVFASGYIGFLLFCRNSSCVWRLIYAGKLARKVCDFKAVWTRDRQFACNVRS